MLDLLKTTVRDFMEDECPRMAAALSYYTVFALPPLLLLLLAIAGTFWSPQEVARAIQNQVSGLMGPAGASEIQQILESGERVRDKQGWALPLSVAGLLFGASGAFSQLQGALNRAWEVGPDPAQGGIKRFLVKRLFSFGMVLGVAFLLLVSLVLSAALEGFGNILGGMLGGASESMLQMLHLAISAVVFTGLFATIFKVLPDAEVEWRDVGIGAVFTTLLFIVGKFAIGVYLGQSDPGSAFGAAGSLAVMLVWIYYASMILLLGAEFTQAWAHRRGGGIEPEPGAVHVVRETKRVRS